MRIIFHLGCFAIALLIVAAPALAPTPSGGFTYADETGEHAAQSRVLPAATTAAPATATASGSEVLVSTSTAHRAPDQAPTAEQPTLLSTEEIAVTQTESSSKPQPPEESVPTTAQPPIHTSEPDSPQTTPTLTTLLLEETNHIRTKAGRAALTLEPTLTNIAQQKADDMAERDFFSHTDPDGCDQTCLLEQTTLSLTSWGENLIEYPYLEEPTATKLTTATIESWHDSRGHRENQLSRQFTHVGFGVAQTNDTYYIVGHYATFME